MITFIETESRKVVARDWGGGKNRELVCMGMEFQFCKTRRILKMDSGNGCATM